MKRVSVYAIAIIVTFTVGMFLHGPYDSAAKHPRKVPVEMSCTSAQYYDDDSGTCQKR